jgi:membrane protease YdiL (CAAX protease family)
LVGLFSFSITLISLIYASKGEVEPGMGEAELTNRFNHNQLFVINMIPFVIGFLLLFYAARIIHRRTFLSFITTRPQLDLRRIAVGLLVWGSITAILFAAELAQGAAHYNWNFEMNDFILLLILSIAIVPIQTGFEEILIRGFTMQLFARFVKIPIVVVLMSAGIFLILHLGNPEVDSMGYVALVYYLLSGIMTAIIAVMDDGLELSWGFHIANNFFAILIVTSDTNALRTDAIYLDTSPQQAMGLETLIVPVLFFPLFVFILSRIYRWKNWKGKLFQPIQPVVEQDNDDLQD